MVCLFYTWLVWAVRQVGANAAGLQHDFHRDRWRWLTLAAKFLIGY